MNGDTFSTISLLKTSSRMFAQSIDKLFDVIFRHHRSSDNRRGRFEECVVTMYQQIMTKLRKSSNISVPEINTLQKKSMFGMKIGLVSPDVRG